MQSSTNVSPQGPVQRSLPNFKLSSLKGSCHRIDLRARVASNLLVFRSWILHWVCYAALEMMAPA